jgi:hypothetical protein
MYKILMLVCLFLPLFVNGDTCCFEAEKTATIESPFNVIRVVNKKDSASAEHALEIKQGAGSGSKVGGRVTYKFTVSEDGTYIFWARVWWLDSCGNSFTFSYNNGKKITLGNDNTYKRWHWKKSRIKLKLSKGEHTLTIFNREDGIKIDQLLITNDKLYIPQGIEKIK